MKKRIPGVVDRSVKSLHEETKVRVDSEQSYEYEVRVGCTKDLCCDLFILQL